MPNLDIDEYPSLIELFGRNPECPKCNAEKTQWCPPVPRLYSCRMCLSMFRRREQSS